MMVAAAAAASSGPAVGVGVVDHGILQVKEVAVLSLEEVVEAVVATLAEEVSCSL